jgi:hypothetical protein
MLATLGPQFELVRELEYVHVSPGGKEQKFFFGVFRRQ